MHQIAPRDEPIHSSTIVIMMILMQLQTVFFELNFYYMLRSNHALVSVETMQQADVISRYMIISIEMLFIIVPIRHNFQIHSVEI
jgi:hypothetical protein